MATLILCCQEDSLRLKTLISTPQIIFQTVRKTTKKIIVQNVDYFKWRRCLNKGTFFIKRQEPAEGRLSSILMLNNFEKRVGVACHFEETWIDSNSVFRE